MRQEDSRSAPAPRDYLTIFLVSCTVMLFQLTLTRVLSVVVWYHFAFLTISLVMLGLGAPGVWFAFAKRPQRWLPATLFLSGVTVPAGTIALIKLGTEMIAESEVYIVLFVLPAMLSLGAAVCLLLMKASDQSIGRMYGIDLLGACLAAVVIIPLMHTVPTPYIAAGAGILPLIALGLYGGRSRVAAIVVSTAVVFVMGGTELLKVTQTKLVDETVCKPVYVKWTPIARITVFDETFNTRKGFTWGAGSKFPEDLEVRNYWLDQDGGGAGTPITYFDGDLQGLRHLFFDVTTIGYQLRPPKKVTVIGGGGGRDILSALRAGAERVDAVELNRHTIEAVTHRFKAISGDVYNLPGVRAIANEGRSHLTHIDERFDLIQISLIDSWAASVAGAFALAENNLYTVEAFQLYLRRLSDAGFLSTSRWSGELPRLLILARAALAAEGFRDPTRHMILTRAGGGVGTLLLSKQPIEQAELERLWEICDRRGFEVVYPPRPGGAPDPLVDIAEGRYESLEKNHLNTDPPTDDSPYFFHVVSPFDTALLGVDVIKITGINVNLGSVVILQRVMIIVTGLSVLLFLFPFILRVFARRPVLGGEGSIGQLARGSLYFAAIGTAFMLLENLLLQRFVLYLGHPSYALTVIVATLLLGMGIGSTLAHRLGVAGLRRLGWPVPTAQIALIAVLPTLFEATLSMPHPVRIALSCLVLTPLGAILGLFFPLGMVHFGDANKPWFWAVNGMFGVVASVMALALSMEFGFTVVGWISASTYTVAWLCLFGEGARRPG